jgi:transposase
LKKTDSEDGLSTGLSLLYVWKAEPITGLTPLLTLALRLLTLVEMPERRGLEQTQESVAGLYKGAPTHPTERPTGTRIL